MAASSAVLPGSRVVRRVNARSRQAEHRLDAGRSRVAVLEPGLSGIQGHGWAVAGGEKLVAADFVDQRSCGGLGVGGASKGADDDEGELGDADDPPVPTE